MSTSLDGPSFQAPNHLAQAATPTNTVAAQTATAAISVEKPWGAVAGTLYGLGVAFFGGLILASVVLFAVLSLFGMNMDQASKWLETVQGALVASALSAVFAITAIVLFLKKRRANLKSIGLGHMRLSYIWTALAAVAVYFVSYIIIVSVIKVLVPSLNLEQEQQLGFNKPEGFIALASAFATLVIIPPLLEEIIFRGFMYTGARHSLPFVPAALLTSVFFAAGHLQFGSGAPLLWVAAIDTMVLSLVMCFVRERTGSIWPTIMMHALKNLVAFTFLYIVK